MNRKFSIKSVVALMLAASALTCAVIAVVIAGFFRYDFSNLGEIEKYIELRHYIDDLYIGDYTEEELSDAAFSAAVEALDDRWSYYMTAEDYASYLNQSNNQYAGIGVRVQKDESTGGLLVMNVFEGTPAEEAGILPGEIITTVGGTDITDLTAAEAGSLIGSYLDNTVTLTVLNVSGEAREVSVTCELIFTNPVSYEMLDDMIGLIVITNFDADSAEQMIGALDELIGEGAEKIIFDVRNNGGGRVTEMTEMLDKILPEGEIFISVDRDGTETVTSSGESCVALPMAVLVNRNTYSAAEYFAAVLGEYDWAVTVGEQTTGKGRSQITVALSGGGALHISSKEYLTPDRISLSDTGGLTPQYEVALSDENFTKLYYRLLDHEDDLQLQEAIALLNEE